MKNSKSRIISCIIICLALISSDALPLSASYQTPMSPPSRQVNSIENKNANGSYVISVLTEDKWQEAGRLSFDMFLTEKTLDLSNLLAENSSAAVRITREGGAAAHLDSVFLGGETPQSVNFNDGILLLKLSKKDMDLINVASEGIDLLFPANRRNNILSVSGIIAGERVTRETLEFPGTNTHKQIDESPEFYTYKLNSAVRTLAVDGNLEEIEGLEPLFKEFSMPAAGYPEGCTYIWIMNDETHLYAVMDFTPDNTADDDLDYTKLYIKTDSGIKEFKVSDSETAWGLASFTYTDKVEYQHKVYEFKIPKKEISVDTDNSLQLAFSAYGTAAPY